MIDQIIERAIEIENEEPEPRRAFLVIGPEGSGGYMLTEALVAAGCYWEQDFQNIEADNYPTAYWYKKPWPLVIHRSLPHAGKWPNLTYLMSSLHSAWFEIDLLLILRDNNATFRSVMRRDPPREPINSAYGLQLVANAALNHSDEFTYVTYEAFCLSDGFRRWLFEERLQLPYPADFEIKYANEKYYQE